MVFLILLLALLWFTYFEERFKAFLVIFASQVVLNCRLPQFFINARCHTRTEKSIISRIVSGRDEKFPKFTERVNYPLLIVVEKSNRIYAVDTSRPLITATSFSTVISVLTLDDRLQT